MTLTPIKTPLVAKKMFPNFVWDMATDTKDLYLTFDDGPTPEITEWVLKVLKEYNALATFFCIGKNIEEHPNIFKEIITAGHAIGNHTQNHLKGWKTDSDVYIENTIKAQSLINLHQTNVSNFKLFRPPYGKIKPSQSKSLLALNYKIIMWDVISFDWDKEVSEETCLNNVISKATKGSIVVFHDSIKASKNMQYALPKVLEHFSNLGYNFKPITF
ncbi:polysaccharide deacetylase family protein [Siansivirga zeaxanthinifaciens]|uniref:Polysaccharide deacetylase n=1 Tax=Siansivirga zeaxanthinifaciens CC-SAMT-1 TaxID=1454006 RepID=A0A0C5WA11_9FLAO|nr:polysaccharide deacetylase family protein [Siansivirga zeaxanthinifaciens]AJR03147.1 polysaccharide deacetylase [Siansivirga zeaxanthinifaciens CC-SAMT-1]